nr:MAG TPA: hypothetical protein [Caudoviricetes sp.]
MYIFCTTRTCRVYRTHRSNSFGTGMFSFLFPQMGSCHNQSCPLVNRYPL